MACCASHVPVLDSINCYNIDEYSRPMVNDVAKCHQRLSHLQRLFQDKSSSCPIVFYLSGTRCFADSSKRDQVLSFPKPWIERNYKRIYSPGRDRCIGRESNPGLADIIGRRSPDGNGQFYH